MRSLFRLFVRVAAVAASLLLILALVVLALLTLAVHAVVAGVDFIACAMMAAVHSDGWTSAIEWLGARIRSGEVRS